LLCTHRNTHYDAVSGYAKLFAELGAGSLAVGIALVVLIPFLRKLITDKAETPPVEAATVVPVA
jgi:POT family proton-dependent oligopeptide transporter